MKELESSRACNRKKVCVAGRHLWGPWICSSKFVLKTCKKLFSSKWKEMSFYSNSLQSPLLFMGSFPIPFQFIPSFCILYPPASSSPFFPFLPLRFPLLHSSAYFFLIFPSLSPLSYTSLFLSSHPPSSFYINLYLPPYLLYSFFPSLQISFFSLSFPFLSLHPNDWY